MSGKKAQEHIEEEQEGHQQAPPSPVHMRDEQPGAAERQEALRQAEATMNKEHQQPVGFCGKLCSTICCGWCATCC